MSAMQEVLQSTEKALTAINALQKKQDEIEQKVSKGDGLDKEMITKAGDDASKALEAAQKIEVELKSLEKSNDFIEKAIARLGEGGGDSGQLSEQEQKVKQEMDGLLRKGREISDDTNEFISKQVFEEILSRMPEDQRPREIKALAVGSNPDGGYLIRPQVSNMMIKRIFETSNIREICSVETIGTDTLEIVIDDDESGAAEWVGETTAPSETDTPQIGKLIIPVHEQKAEPKATQKMIDDSTVNIESWLVSVKQANKFARGENQAFIRGNSSQRPQGILSLPDWTVADTYERFKLERINSGSAGAFTTDGLIACQNQLKEEYQPNAVWGIKRAAFTQILQLKATDGHYLINPDILREGAGRMLLGQRVIFMDDLDGLAVNGQSAIYGDFAMGYTIVDRLGLRVLRDPYTQKPFIKFYITKRVGGAVTNFESLKIQRLAA